MWSENRTTYERYVFSYNLRVEYQQFKNHTMKTLDEIFHNDNFIMKNIKNNLLHADTCLEYCDCTMQK